MEISISYAGMTSNRLFGKAVHRSRLLLREFLSDLNKLMDALPSSDYEKVTLIICDGHSLEFLKEEVKDGHAVVTVGIAPGLSFAKKDDPHFAAFLIERVRFYLQHKEFITPELADFLEAEIRRVREPTLLSRGP